MTLIFVYNANSGLLNAVFDATHKLVSPQTYNCQLCNLTHNAIREKKLWKRYQKQQDAKFLFYHKDEFKRLYPKIKVKYPAVLKLDHTQMNLLLSEEALKSINSTEDLIKHLNTIL
jgi:hypothetical protein